MRVTRLYGVHNRERDAPTRPACFIDRQRIIRFKHTASDARDPAHYAEVLEQFAELP